MPGREVPSIKGVSFVSVLKIVERDRSRATIEEALGAMDREVADALRYGTVIASGWYPVTWYRAMWRALLAVTGGGDDFVKQVGRASIDHDFNTIYKAVFRMLRPRTLVSIGVKHFGQIYDTGAVAVEEKAATQVRVRWSGCTGFDHAMWIEILGSCERLAELAGGTGGRAVIHEGGADDQDHCVADIRWR
jgi:hypothetical protein